MRVDVTMPQMGESIAEGTITRWIKKVGDAVERDEPIFEISTDKVDAEIPSPSAGTLVEIKSQEGDTVPVNDVVAVIETEAGAESASASDSDSDSESESGAESDSESEPKAESKAESQADRKTERKAEPETDSKAESKAESRFVSPVVRRIAAEAGVDPHRVPGTGAGGRVTKKDIQAFLDGGGATSEPAPPASPGGGAPAAPARPAAPRVGPAAPSFESGERTVHERMSVMRKKIAEHMLESRRTSAHVHSVFEVDVTRLVNLRRRYKDAYVERHGAKLSFMAFWIKAICDGLRDWPIVNASVSGDEIVYKKDLNIGIAVALDWGLIVPVVRNADDLSLAGLSKRVQDLAERARSKQLNPDEVQGGTFTITNPGQFGGLYGLPIINQPQVAILGLGGIEKRPVVIDDAIAIRSMQYMALSYDHRVVDGAVADQFLAGVKRGLEQFDESLL